MILSDAVQHESSITMTFRHIRRLSILLISSLIPWDLSHADDSYEPTILNGVSTSLSSIPYQARLLIYKSTSSGTVAYLCGASLIDDSVAITAAHCVDSDSSETLTSVTVYYLDYTTPSSPTYTSVSIPASNVSVHSSWDGTLATSNDIAVLYDSGASFTNAKKIKIATAAEMTAMFTEFSNSYVANQDNDTNVQASGYGKDENGSSGSLARVLLAGIPSSTCRSLKASSVSADDYLCVQSPVQSVNYGICSGDSGGPLVWRNPSNASDSDYGVRLVGAASYVTTSGGLCKLNGSYYYGAYSNINYYKSFVNSAVDTLASTSGYDYESLSISYAFDSDPILSANTGTDSTTPDSGSSSDDSGSGGGGGGSLSLITLMLLTLLALRRHTRCAITIKMQ